MKRKYYKVVRILKNNRKVSCVVKEKELRLSYSENNFTYPKIENSKILVFGSLDEAKHFNDERNFNKSEIWEIEKIGRASKIINLQYSSKESIDAFRIFWSSHHYRNWRYCARDPEGTYGVKAVRLNKLMLKTY